MEQAQRNVHDLVNAIKQIMIESEIDALKADKGNKLAGIRLRKKLLEVSNLCVNARKRVIEKRTTKKKSN